MGTPRPRLSVTPLEDRITPYVFGPTDDRGPSALSSVVRIVSEFPNGSSTQGSGVFVNNFHVLTAGHVIWDKNRGGMATRVVVQQPIYTSSGQVQSTYTGFGNVLRAGRGWTDSRDFNHDWGLVRLARDSVANGAWGLQVMAAATDAVLAGNASAFVTAGYPGDKGGRAQYRTTAPVAGRTALTVTSYGDTYSGQSGGPLYLDRDFYENVYGVVSNEAIPAGSKPNGFVRLTPTLLDQLNDYMDADNAAYAQLPPTQSRLTIVPVGSSGSGGYRGVVAGTSTAPPADDVPPIPLPTEPPPPLPADLTEGDLADWSTRADFPPVTPATDTTRKFAGDQSLTVSVSRWTIDLNYTVPGGVADVSPFRALHFSLYARTHSGEQFAAFANPVVVLTDSSDNAFLYLYRRGGVNYPIINQALDTWLALDVPLYAPEDPTDGWLRFARGNAPPDLTRIKTVTFATGLDSGGYSLWLDDVGFRGYPPAGDESPVVPVNVPPDPYGPGTSPDQNTAFVKGLYRTVLGRDADAGGLAAWVAAMNAGLTPLAATRGFWNSPENRAVQVDGYYRTFLGREPDAAGRQNWMNALLSGAADEITVASLFLQSPEMIARGGTTGGYVDLLYRTVLGRDADPAGRADWVQKIDSGAITRPQLVAGLVRSVESYNRVLSSFYRAYLKRVPSSGELADWRAVIDGLRVPLGDVAVGFVGSQEFYANAAGAVG